MIKHGFLSNAERSELLRIARNGLEEHRVSRRANAILLLNDGMSFKQVAAALYIDDSTIRAWRKAYEDGGIDALDTFDLKGGFSPLSNAQMDTLRAWANETIDRRRWPFHPGTLRSGLYAIRPYQADASHRIRLEEAGDRAGQNRRGNPATRLATLFPMT